MYKSTDCSTAPPWVCFRSHGWGSKRRQVRIFASRKLNLKMVWQLTTLVMQICFSSLILSLFNVIYTCCMIQVHVKVLYFVNYISTEIKPIEPRDVLPKPDVIPGRVGRRTKRQISGQTQTSVEGRTLIRCLGFVWYPTLNSTFFSSHSFIFYMRSSSFVCNYLVWSECILSLMTLL